MNEFDEFFEQSFKWVWKNRTMLNTPNLLSSFVASMQRANYYDELLTEFVLEEYLKTKIFDEDQDTDEIKLYFLLKDKLEELEKTFIEKQNEFQKEDQNVSERSFLREHKIRINEISSKMKEMRIKISKKENIFSHLSKILHFMAKNVEFFNISKDISSEKYEKNESLLKD